MLLGYVLSGILTFCIIYLPVFLLYFIFRFKSSFFIALGFFFIHYILAIYEFCHLIYGYYCCNINFKFVRIHLLSFIIALSINVLIYQGLYNENIDALTGIESFSQELEYLMEFGVRLFVGLSIMGLLVVRDPEYHEPLVYFVLFLNCVHRFLVIEYGAFY